MNHFFQDSFSLYKEILSTQLSRIHNPTQSHALLFSCLMNHHFLCPVGLFSHYLLQLPLCFLYFLLFFPLTFLPLNSFVFHQSFVHDSVPHGNVHMYAFNMCDGIAFPVGGDATQNGRYSCSPALHFALSPTTNPIPILENIAGHV